MVSGWVYGGASGLLFDLRQITWAVSVVLDQGEAQCWNGSHRHCISDLSFPWKENLDVWTRRELGHDLVCHLVCACKGEGVLMSAVRPGRASPVFQQYHKIYGDCIYQSF